MKTPVPESLFNKRPGLTTLKRLWHMCGIFKSAIIYRTAPVAASVFLG